MRRKGFIELLIPIVVILIIIAGIWGIVRLDKNHTANTGVCQYAALVPAGHTDKTWTVIAIGQTSVSKQTCSQTLNVTEEFYKSLEGGLK